MTISVHAFIISENRQFVKLNVCKLYSRAACLQKFNPAVSTQLERVLTMLRLC